MALDSLRISPEGIVTIHSDDFREWIAFARAVALRDCATALRVHAASTGDVAVAETLLLAADIVAAKSDMADDPDMFWADRRRSP